MEHKMREQVIMESPIPWLIPEECVFVLAILGIVFTYQIIRTILTDLAWLIKTYAPAFYRPYNYIKVYGEWAAITGCTAGIGLSLCKEMARRGVSLVLISRNEDKLNVVAKDLEKEFKIKTKIIVCNAVCRESVMKMAGELSKLDIGIMVNNVGINSEGSKERMDELGPDYVYRMITINTGSAIMTMKHVLPNMMATKKGIVINVCSTSSIVPTPLQSLYCGTKVFMDALSQAIVHEVSTDRVAVQSICPILVQSNMTSSCSNLIHNTLSLSGETYSRSVINTIGSSERTNGHWFFDLFIKLCQLLLNETFLIYFIYYGTNLLKTHKL